MNEDEKSNQSEDVKSNIEKDESDIKMDRKEIPNQSKKAKSNIKEDGSDVKMDIDKSNQSEEARSNVDEDEKGTNKIEEAKIDIEKDESDVKIDEIKKSNQSEQVKTSLEKDESDTKTKIKKSNQSKMAKQIVKKDKSDIKVDEDGKSDQSEQVKTSLENDESNIKIDEIKKPNKSKKAKAITSVEKVKSDFKIDEDQKSNQIEQVKTSLKKDESDFKIDEIKKSNQSEEAKPSVEKDEIDVEMDKDENSNQIEEVKTTLEEDESDIKIDEIKKSYQSEQVKTSAEEDNSDITLEEIEKFNHSEQAKTSVDGDESDITIEETEKSKGTEDIKSNVEEDESDSNISLSTTTLTVKEYDAENENFKNKRQADLEGVLTDEIPEPKYKILEKVYARDENKLLYLAFIRRSMHGPVKTMLDEDGIENEERETWHYFIHFHKWSSKWDSWIVEDDVFTDNEQNRGLAMLLTKSVRGIRSSKKICEKIIKTEKKFWAERMLKDDQEETNRLHEEHVKEEKKKEARLKKLKEKSMCAPLPQALAEKISLTLPLKKIMVDEWEAITQLNLAPTIPAQVTIKSVLNGYLDSKLDLISDTSEQEEWKIAIRELLIYFDKAILYLLYPQETPYSDDTILKPCEIYSCEYLLRLMTKLPALIKEERKSFCLKMSDLVRYLNKNQYTIFQQNYKKIENNNTTTATSTTAKKISTTEVKGREIKKRGRKRKKLKGVQSVLKEEQLSKPKE